MGKPQPAHLPNNQNYQNAPKIWKCLMYSENSLKISKIPHKPKEWLKYPLNKKKKPKYPINLRKWPKYPRNLLNEQNTP